MFSVPGAAQHSEPRGVAIAPDREAVALNADRLNTGQSLDATHQLSHQRDGLRVFSIAGTRRSDVHQHQMIGLKSNIDVQ